MKKITATLIVAVGFAGFAAVADQMRWLTTMTLEAPLAAQARGQRAATPPAPPAAPAAQQPQQPPAFDGNVANILWGGRLESITGETKLANARVILFDSFGGSGDYGTPASPGPTEIVVSFFKHETARIGSVTITTLSTTFGQMKDVEVWASPGSATEGFTKLADAAVALESSPFKRPETTLTFPPVDSRFVKVRFTTHHPNGRNFRIVQIKVTEAAGAGYVPLLKRHPEILEPTFVAEGAAAAAAQAPPTTGCAPAAVPPMQPGNGESKNVLLVMRDTVQGSEAAFIPLGIKSGRIPKTHTSTSPELKIFDRVTAEPIAKRHAQPWMLADYDTVVFEQICDFKNVSPRFLPALVAWVAAGHKLIIHDADKCGANAIDYSWLPYRFKSDNPGALGAPGSVLKVLENNWMAHTLRSRPGFVDAGAWVALKPPANELGDSNAVTQWDPGWCGHMVVRNANGIFGFVQAYAHYGRGLIIWDGFDIDSNGTKWHDIVHAQQLAQGFNTDNLPCSIKIGSFAVTTEPRLVTRGVQAGQTYTYPLSLLSNLGYKGTVSLSAAPSPAMPGLQARFEPATVDVTSLQESAFTVTLPAGSAVKPFAIEVKGTAADGKTNSLCLQLGQTKAGELAVISTLAPPTKTRKNLEIILDASGSMKTPMGAKQTRWDVALETLGQVLNALPDDFNVGLRIYGHRELSTSPKTCTDSELVIPVRKLDRKAILARANLFKPKGETPLVYSALQAPGDLKALGGGTVILITDGEESCKGDAVKAASELKASGLDIRLNIVGFALKNPQTQKDLSGFAQATGGLFYAADSGAGLADAVMLAAVERFPYTVYDAAGKAVVSSEAGSGSDELPPGDYRVVVKAGTRELVSPRVRVALGTATTLKIAIKNGQVVLE
jgi:hypothetical protein